MFVLIGNKSIKNPNGTTNFKIVLENSNSLKKINKIVVYIKIKLHCN